MSDINTWLQGLSMAILGAIWFEIKGLRKRLHDIETWKASQVQLLDAVRSHFIKGGK